jgi:hypothetical protein
MMQAWTRANEVFAPGAEKHSIKLLMKRLQATAVKRDRNSSAKLSISSTKLPKVGQVSRFSSSAVLLNPLGVNHVRHLNPPQ